MYLISDNKLIALIYFVETVSNPESNIISSYRSKWLRLDSIHYSPFGVYRRRPVITQQRTFILSDSWVNLIFTAKKRMSDQECWFPTQTTNEMLRSIRHKIIMPLHWHLQLLSLEKYSVCIAPILIVSAHRYDHFQSVDCIPVQSPTKNKVVK